MFFRYLFARKATEDELVYFKNDCVNFTKQVWAYFPELSGHCFGTSLEFKSKSSLLRGDFIYGQYQTGWLRLGWQGKNKNTEPETLPKAGTYLFKNKEGKWVKVRLEHLTYKAFQAANAGTYMGRGFLD
jgi:hypothetical protein